MFPDWFEPFERFLFPIPQVVCLYFFAHAKLNKYSYLLLTVLALYHLYFIFGYGKGVKKRYELLDHAIAYARQFHEQKQAFRGDNFFVKRLGGDWIMCCESMLLSAEKGKDSVRQVFVQEAYDKKTLTNLKPNQFFFSPLLIDNIDVLNKNYFHFYESPLRYVNTNSIQSNYPKAFFENIKCNIEGNKKLKCNKEYLIPVTIINNNNIPLTSGMNKEKIELSYHWWVGEKAVESEGMKSPLMADVYSSLHQFVNVKTPEKAGVYNLSIDLVYDRQKWMNIKGWKSFEIK